MSSHRNALSLAALCATVGTLHFAKPDPFDELIPAALPGSARAWTIGSGVAELAVAGLLCIPQTRKRGGWVAAALFVAVFPGNLQMAWNWRHRPWPWQLVSVSRLPLQLPLITRALRVARA